MSSENLSLLSLFIAIAAFIVSFAQNILAHHRNTLDFIKMIMESRVESISDTREAIQNDLKRCLLLEHIAGRLYNPPVLKKLLAWEAGYFSLRFSETVGSHLRFSMLDETDKGLKLDDIMMDIKYETHSANTESRTKVENAMAGYYYKQRENYPNFSVYIDCLTEDEYNMRDLRLWRRFSKR